MLHSSLWCNKCHHFADNDVGEQMCSMQLVRCTLRVEISLDAEYTVYVH